MLKEIEKDFSTNPESEQLLSVEACDNSPDTCVRVQPDEQLSMNELCIQGVSSSRSLLQDKSAALNLNTHIGESPSGLTTVVTSSLITASGNESNDDPPPYAAITPPNHTGWPYGLFSFNDSYFTDGTTHRMEIPLTPFQTHLIPVTGFQPEGINGRYRSYPMSLTTRYQFLKFGCYRNSLWRETMDAADDEITEKIYDKKTRTCGVILVAAAVIIFLMALSLIVRFVMEKSWWRR
ncbi:PREDICTED: uncharacterized protein LOC105151155 isoform X1 [Acromyrmex echinatior]|uniref:uncharacterized protein LOC105151155 isoform X1 n=2 Tax=Acromyrmex echinatior TaxID=103372 RepID=UPI000580C28F|nr:PREDICTED: uncharacterized protein LOC105151155 isoform X1 [Acromyrmex echinatior]